MVQNSSGELKPEREHTLDICRGLAVAGVVLVHMLSGLIDANVITDASKADRINDVLSLMRMPALALLLGVLVPGSVSRRGSMGYLRRRLPLLLWLFILWSFIQGAIEVFTSGSKNQPTTWQDVYTLWTPEDQMWFLPYLIVATIVMVAGRPWEPGRRGHLTLFLCLIASVLMWSRNFPYIATTGIALIGFSALGTRIPLRRVSYLSSARSLVVLPVTVIAVTCVCLIAWKSSAQGPTVGRHGLSFLVILYSAFGTACGIAALFGLAVLLSRITQTGRLLTALGQRTLQIYLAHITFYAGIRVVLLKLGVDNVALHIALGLSAGIAGPIALGYFSKYVHAGWLFALPKFNSSRTAAEERHIRADSASNSV